MRRTRAFGIILASFSAPEEVCAKTSSVLSSLSFRACRPSTPNPEWQLACLLLSLDFHCHGLARTCCAAHRATLQRVFLADKKLGPILFRASVAVAGVLAQPVAILLETADRSRRE